MNAAPFPGTSEPRRAEQTYSLREAAAFVRIEPERLTRWCERSLALCHLDLRRRRTFTAIHVVGAAVFADLARRGVSAYRIDQLAAGVWRLLNQMESDTLPFYLVLAGEDLQAAGSDRSALAIARTAEGAVTVVDVAEIARRMRQESPQRRAS